MREGQPSSIGRGFLIAVSGVVVWSWTTLGGYGLYTASLAHLPAGTANLIATMEPVLTTVWAFFLLGESLEGVQLLGGALILGSVASLQLEGKLARLVGARASAGAVCKAPPGGGADGEASLGRSLAP